MASSTRSIPGAGSGREPLADALRSTTRPIHKRLNRLILCRMPLALPPRASDPSIYATGLLHIAPIYMVFEALWKTIVIPPGNSTDSSLGAQAGDQDMYTSPMPLDDFDKPAITLKLGLVLSKLFMPGLRRTAAFRRDLRRLTGWSAAELDAELRRVVTADGALHDFTTHIRKTLEKHPHVSVSYAYTFYMALLSGGQIIRSSLESQGAPFWNEIPVSPAQPGIPASKKGSFDRDPTRNSISGKSLPDETYPDTAAGSARDPSSGWPVDFLRFETPSGVGGLKEEFEGRLHDSESLLTEKEKAEIIQEATVIFEEMLAVVGQLDELFESDKLSDAASKGSGSSDTVQEFNIINNLRDSVVVTKERKGRKAVQVNGGAPGPLPILGEDEDGDASNPSRAIGFSEDLEHIPTPVVASPGNADPTSILPGLDGAEDEVDEVTERHGLLQGGEKQEVDEGEDEHEVQRRWNIHSVLPFLARLTALATFTWIVMLLTAMVIGRSEPFKKGCPNYNLYDN